MANYQKQQKDFIRELKDTRYYWEKNKSTFSKTSRAALSEAKKIRQREIKEAINKEKETRRKKRQIDIEIDEIIYMLDDAIKKESYYNPTNRIKRAVIITSSLAAFFACGVFYSQYSIDNIKPARQVSQLSKKQISDINRENRKPAVPAKSYSTIDDKINDRVNDTKYKKPGDSRAYPILSMNKNTEYWYFPIRGDTLSKISKDISYTNSNWRRIKNYNKLGSDLIEVNQPLRIPPEIVKNKRHLHKGPIDARIYIAKKNDTWNSISRKLCGNNNCANAIISYNRKYNPRFSTKLWRRQYVLVPK